MLAARHILVTAQLLKWPGVSCSISMNYWVIFCRAALFASWHKRTTHDMLSLLRMHVSSLALLTEQLVIVPPPTLPVLVNAT